MFRAIFFFLSFSAPQNKGQRKHGKKLVKNQESCTSSERFLLFSMKTSNVQDSYS